MKSRTIGSGGNDADIPTWEAQINDSDSETGTCIQAADLDGAGAVTLNASLTGGRTALLTADSSSAISSPTWSNATSKARINQNADAVLTISATGFTVEKIGILQSGNHSNTIVTGATTTIRRCVIGTSGSNGASILTGDAVTTHTVTWSNCAIIGTAHGGVMTFAETNGTYKHYHCSFLGSSSNYALVYYHRGAMETWACIVQGKASNNWYTDGGGGTIAGDDNISEDTTAQGSNKRTSAAKLFLVETAGSEDLTLRGLNGSFLAGVTDRSATVSDLSTDISGTARPRDTSFPIDPGCWMVPNGPSVLAYATAGAVQTTEPITVSVNPPLSNCLMVAVVGGTGDTVATVKFNTTESLSSVAAAAQFEATSGVRTYVYTLDNPTTGAHNCVADFNASFSKGWLAVYCLKHAGNSNVPVVDAGDGTTFNSAATSTSKATTTAENNEGAIDLWANGSSGSAPVPDSPEGPNNKASSPSFFEAASSTRLAVTAGSITDGWTFNSGSGGALSVVYVKAGSAGGGVVALQHIHRHVAGIGA